MRLPYTNTKWEKRSIFLNFLISKLPAPDDEDLSKGLLDSIDMAAYRVEKLAMQKILLPDIDAEVDPVPISGGGQQPEPEMDRLSNILKRFNDLVDDIAWKDRDGVQELITRTIPAEVAADPTFQNARKNSDDTNARIEHDKVLARPRRDQHGERQPGSVQTVHGQQRIPPLDDRRQLRASVQNHTRNIKASSQPVIRSIPAVARSVYRHRRRRSVAAPAGVPIGVGALAVQLEDEPTDLSQLTVGAFRARPNLSSDARRGVLEAGTNLSRRSIHLGSDKAAEIQHGAKDGQQDHESAARTDHETIRLPAQLDQNHPYPPFPQHGRNRPSVS